MPRSLPDRSMLVVVNYPWWGAPAGLLSMAIFHLPLFFRTRVSFYKLMGCGRNGTFDIRPAWRQWAVMAFYSSRNQMCAGQNEELPRLVLGNFIVWWWSIFRVRHRVIALAPVAGHGTWNGRALEPNSQSPLTDYEPVAVLTRATIRLSRALDFWSSVPAAAQSLASEPGLVYSVGVGEVPFLRQATFSMWKSTEAMKVYAYGKAEHREAIRKTRELNWYSEEMFLRFRVLSDRTF